MKKVILRVLSLVTLVATLSFGYSTVFATSEVNASSVDKVPEHVVTKVVELTDGRASLSGSDIQEIKDVIKVPGNTVVIQGKNINKNKVFDDILKDFDTPVILDEEQQVLAEDNETMTSFTVGLTMYNHNGKVFTSYNIITLPEGATLEDIDKSTLNRLMKDARMNEIEAFKERVTEQHKSANQEESSFTTASTGGFQGSVEKTENIFGTWSHDGATYTELVGRYNLSYLIYDNGDAEYYNDYFTIKTQGQFETGRAFYNDKYYMIETGAFQSDFGDYYSKDELIEYGPDTQGTDSNIYQQNFSFTIGYPFSVGVNWTYNGESGAGMKAIGDRYSDFYYQLIYDTDYDDLAENLASISYENSAMYKLAWSGYSSSYDRHLKLTARNSFRYHKVAESHSGDKWANPSNGILYYNY